MIEMFPLLCLQGNEGFICSNHHFLFTIFYFFMNIYVGNLNYKVREDDLKELFGEFGEVAFAKVVKDRESHRSKGFGFVELTDDAAGVKAIAELNGQEYEGRNLVVNEARPREDRAPQA